MIGEVAKWIPVNVVRFSGISYDSSSVSVTLRGVQGETIAVRGLAECVCACARVRCVFVSGLVLQHQVPVGDECVMHVW